MSLAAQGSQMHYTSKSVGGPPMRELIVTENITIDGAIEATENWFDPAGDDAEVDQSDIVAAIREQRDGADAFLVGRVTFEEMRGYWPQQTDDTTGITDYLNAVSKYVVSKTLQEPAWENTTVLRGPPMDEIQALKSQPGKDIVTTGSITLVRDLIANGLVDEYRLFVYPVVLGNGRRLFADARGVPGLRLVENRSFRSGIVLLRYRTA
jgi:dihydrofolate reductase